jgi:iron complex transport system substrate-binding protein
VIRTATGVLVMALAACTTAGGDAGSTTTTAGAVDAAALPVTLPVTLRDSSGRDVTVSSIERIVPVDGDLAEIVFALGLGDHVVATDLSATYPPEADALPQIGYQRALSAEPIAALEPTVVLATDLAGPVETLDQLRALGIPVVVIEREPTLDGPGNKIRAVAGALGISGRGDELARSTDADIARAAEAGLGAAPALRPRVLVLYLRGEQVQLVMGAGTGVDALLPAVGAVDVAAELGVIDTEQLTAEALVLAAPDALVVTDTGLESVGGIDGLLSIPGIAQTPAGATRRVLAYDDQLLLGGGPRTGELIRQLAADLVASTVPTPTQEDS